MLSGMMEGMSESSAAPYSDPPADRPSRLLPGETMLLWITMLTALGYLAFFVFYSNPAWSDGRMNRELFVWPASLGLVALYINGYWNFRHWQAVTSSTGVRWVLGGAVILSLLAFLTPPFHSTDIFGYINRGWQQWHYGVNPYVTAVVLIPGWEADPMLTNHWVHNPSPYGFFYILIAKWLVGLAQWIHPGDKVTAVTVFKAFNLLVFWLAAGVVYKAAALARMLSQSEGVLHSRQASAAGTEPLGSSQSGIDANNRRALVLYLFLWNPLMLIHNIANGHNDLVMSLWIALAFWACLAGRWVWILPALTAAILVKYAAVVIIPFALLLFWKHNAWRPLLLGGFLALVFAAVVGWPYLQDWQHFNLVGIGRNAQVSHSSLHAMIYDAIELFFPLLPVLEDYKIAIRTALKYLLLTGYVAFFTWSFKTILFPSAGSANGEEMGKGTVPSQTTFSPERFIKLSTLAVVLLVGVVTFKFYPWYLAMVFPLIFFLREGHWLRQLVLVLTCTHMLSLTVIGQAHVLNYLLMVLLPTLAFFWWKRRRSAIRL